MKIIKHEDIVNLNISNFDCYQWVLEAIKNKKNSILPAKISLKQDDGIFCNVMPCMINVNKNKYEGVKIVTRYPERVPSLDSKILLMDADTGEYLSFIDANWITAMRTGAVAAHSIITFAKKNYKTIGIIGAGNVSRATLLILCEIEKNKEFNIKIYIHNNDEYDFKERFRMYDNLHFEFVDSYHDLVKGSDVVISGVTYAPNDFCSDEDFDEGVLVVPIHTLGFTNCDLFFDKVFGDDYYHICGFKNFNKFKSFNEVSDVVNEKVKGRENDSERIIVYNVGIAIHDIVFASHIYDLLKKNDKLPEITINNPTDKHWL